MPICITCPSCKSSFAVSDAVRGKTILCKGCKKPFTIPAAAAAPPASAAELQRDKPTLNTKPKARKPLPDDDEDEKDVRPRSRQAAAGGAGGAAVLLVVGGIAAVVLLLAGGGVLAAVFLLGSKSDTPKPAAEAPQAVVSRSETKVAARPDTEPEPAKTETHLPNTDVTASPKNVAPPQIEIKPPKVQLAPPEIDVKPPVEVPAGSVPGQISREAVDRAKKATTYIRAELPGGDKAEGSGFFALEPGLVLTNAHVVGMLGSNSAAPTKIELVLNGGDAGEPKMAATIVGVDHDSGLAVLRAQGDASRMPPPLPVDSAAGLIETQKLYIFGFPLGLQLGKSITVSDSSVASLRRDGGMLTQVQVNGGMHAGNSGGPVTDARGVVIGVAVAGIQKKQINFAIPGDAVKLVLEGRHTGTEVSLPFVDDSQTKMTVKLACLDPMSRIRDLKLQVWTGSPGVRPPSFVEPPVQPGDGPRQAVPVKYQNGVGTAEIILPVIETGKVLWLQPMLTSSSGKTHWAAATAHQPSDLPPLERRAAHLQMKFPPTDTQRTVKMKGESTVKTIGGGLKVSSLARHNSDFEMLETVRAEGTGGSIQIVFGDCRFRDEESARVTESQPQFAQILRQLPAGFIVDGTGAFTFARLSPGGGGKGPLMKRNDANELYTRACDSYELACVSVPNRTVSPRETWTGRLRIVQPGAGAMMLDVTCTYEGTRMTAGRPEAYVTMAGDLRFPPKLGGVARLKGKVKGSGVFHLEGGYFSRAKILVNMEEERDGTTISITHDTDLTRTPGNVLNIIADKVAGPVTGPQPGLGGGVLVRPPPLSSPHILKPGLVGQVVVVNKLATLTQIDLDDTKRPGCKAKIETGKLAAGKQYTITMTRAIIAKVGTDIDPYLRVENVSGVVLAEADNGGRAFARIVFTPPQAGQYRIVCTSATPGVGAYNLTVTTER